MLSRHVGRSTSPGFDRRLDGDEGEPHPVGIAEGEHGLAEPLLRHVMCDALFDQPLVQ